MSTVWFNGEIREDESVSFSAFDHPLWRGDGVFESTRTEGSQIFFLRRHLERLAHSAQLLEMVPPDVQALTSAALEVASSSSISGNSSLRITAFPNGDRLITHRAVAPKNLAPKLVIYPEPQFSQSRMHSAKSLSYARSATALRWAEKHGANEVVFLDEAGLTVETALANFVAEIDGEFVTPLLPNGGLRGITRSLALEWFPEISERHITVADLERATGILLLSGVRFIRPALSLNGRDLHNSSAAQAIASDFELRAQANPNY
jgi:branched-subunit amino acid aminotransferase/4-amino-4-deoxychorismate lyase